MCRATLCTSCGKITWAGCGQHVASVRASVPANQWCDGHADQRGGGLFGRLFGRR